MTDGIDEMADFGLPRTGMKPESSITKSTRALSLFLFAALICVGFASAADVEVRTVRHNRHVAVSDGGGILLGQFDGIRDAWRYLGADRGF